MQSFLKRWFPEVMQIWLHQTYCGLKITKVTNFPYFIAKFAFGQATNHRNVGYGANYT